MPSFSLVIPTFNRSRLVQEAVRSATAQTRKFDEIIVVDDGSEDDTIEALLALGNDRVIVEQIPNSGTVVARSRGLERATGEWVCLLDSDDLLDPSYLDRIESVVLREPGIDACYSNFRLFDESGIGSTTKLDDAPGGFWDVFTERWFGFVGGGPPACLKLLEFQPLFVSGAAFRRSAFVSIGGFDPSMNRMKSEDLEFTLRVVGQLRVGIIASPIAMVRRHAGNDSADFGAQRLGEATVLQFAASRHSWASTPEIRRSLYAEAESRILDGLRAGFGIGRWDIADAASVRIRGSQRLTGKDRVKIAFLSARRSALRTAGWLTERLRGGDASRRNKDT